VQNAQIFRKEIPLQAWTDPVQNAQNIGKGKGIPLQTWTDPAQNAQIISKGKGIPLQAWTGPEGSRRLRLPYFKTKGT
jgi:hypothetical protein